ncbi:MAG: DUF4292 domain-containing protein [Candidatus Tectomicrobia bacterium]|uniref:DUF4292 domain-containing protein n=1 Tax=Tectimicrobiota bacterium TaxID=2528274 RepID=A0A932G104_UNCTE|nr:DUF4292 domain-containing protein [Candidatus Tectomicrobia bacterium]
MALRASRALDPESRIQHRGSRFRTWGSGWIRLAVFAGVMAALGGGNGCAYLRRVPRLPTVKGPLPGTLIPSPQPFLKAAQEQRGSFRDLQAMALVSIRSPWGTFRSRQLIRLRKNPPFLRMETLGPIGPSLYVLADEKQLLLYSPFEGRLLRARPSPDQVRKLIRLPLSVPEVVNLLAGLLPPLGDGAWQVSLSYQEKRQQYWLQLSSAGDRPYQRAWMGADMALQGYQLYDADGRVTLIAHYQGSPQPGEGPKSEGGGAGASLANRYVSPRAIQVYLPREKTFLELTYQELNLNEGLPDFLFELPVPPGVEVQEME